MILVVGGLASGKRSYVRSLGYDDAQMDGKAGSGLPVLYGLEELLRKGPLNAEQRASVLAREIVICCEVGLGVVPVNPEERAWRELVGRTCVDLAGHAERVVRMVCGIPQVIKEG